MATHTDYFNLEKPESYENYNIAVFNSNADTIDLQMHNNQTSAAKVMVGATSLADGESGRVPTPHAGDEDKVLKGDGTWGAVNSNVEANPSGTPTETLETIGIDNVIYQLPEGGDTEITGDAEGSVISIDDGKLNEPLKACTVDINPVQSGSGTPSPSNIRPISGWTEANITVADATVSPTVSNTYNIEFEDSGSPLTVYEGTLDTVSGVLTVTNEIKTFIGADEENWALMDVNSRRFRISVSGYSSVKLTSHFLNKNSYTGVWGECRYASDYLNLLDGNSTIANTTALKTWLASQNANGTPVQFMFELATPITYQLTPAQITTLYGNNVIWADSGDMAIKYVRDTSIAINDALNQSITPTYSSGTKIADYNIGGHTGAIYVQGAGGQMDTLWTGSETPTMSYNPTITLAHPISDYDFLLVNFNIDNEGTYLKATLTLYGATVGDNFAQAILPSGYAAMFVNILNDYNITLNCYGRNYENTTTYISIIGVKL